MTLLYNSFDFAYVYRTLRAHTQRLKTNTRIFNMPTRISPALKAISLAVSLSFGALVHAADPIADLRQAAMLDQDLATAKVTMGT